MITDFNTYFDFRDVKNVEKKKKRCISASMTYSAKNVFLIIIQIKY